MDKEKDKRQKIRRYFDGLYNKSEVSDLLKSMQNSEMQEIIDEIGNELWEESMKQSSFLRSIEHEKYKNEAALLLKKINKRPVKKRVSGWAAAACAILIFTLGWGIVEYLNNKEEKILYTEISTTFGEKKEWILPDGTTVYLNACSTLKYPEQFNGKERKVELTGEAFFQVTRNEQQPFSIRTARFNIKVLGTSFNVKAYTDNEITQVNVKSGKVQVDLPEAMIRLAANEQIQINSISNEYSKKKEDHKQALAWIQNKLHYNNTPLHDIVNDLERIYNCQIKFAPGQKADYLLSGDHDNNNLQAVLQSIEYVTGIKYKQEGNYILLYK